MCRLVLVSLMGFGFALMAAPASAQAPALELSIVPLGGTQVQGGSMVTVEVFMTANRNVRVEGGQIDLPCTLPGGNSGSISIAFPGNAGGGTTDPDGDGARGPSSGGVPYLFGPGGLGPYAPATCIVALTPPIGGSPFNLASGTTRYLATYSYVVSDCAEGTFDLVFEGVRHPPTGVDTTRFREDEPPGVTQGLLVDLGINTPSLSVVAGRCCSGSTCRGVMSRSCCLDVLGGQLWTEGLTCDDPCPPCTNHEQCNDQNPCTDDSCSAGACVNLPNIRTCDDGLFCTVNDRCAGGSCQGVEGSCPGRFCDEELNICVDCVNNSQCIDGNPCTDNRCVAGVCMFPPNTTACNDGLFCTTNDTCLQGQCRGLARPCAEGQMCWEEFDACLNPTVIHCTTEARPYILDDWVPMHCGLISAVPIEVGGVDLDFPCRVEASPSNTLFSRGLVVDPTAEDPPFLFGLGADVYIELPSCLTRQRPAPGVEGVAVSPGESYYLATMNYGIFDCEAVRYQMAFENLLTQTRLLAPDGTPLPFSTVVDPVINTTGQCCDGSRCTEVTEFCCLSTGTGIAWTPNARCSDSIVVECQACESAQDCDDDNVCTADTCVKGQCIHTSQNQGSFCEDDLFCTGSSLCSLGFCRGVPKGETCGLSHCREDLDECVECLTAAQCDDFNPCTSDFCTIDGTCVFLNNDLPCNDQLFCTRDDRCASGVCQGTPRCPDHVCDELEDRCIPNFCLETGIEGSVPPDNIVDARQPHLPYDATRTGLQGLGSEVEPIVIMLNAVGADPYCFELCETAIEEGFEQNSIDRVIEGPPGTYLVFLSRPITAGAMTTVQYAGHDFVVFKSHPSNTDGNEIASIEDVIALLEQLRGNEMPRYGLYSNDSDRSGAFNPLDLMRIIELHTGAVFFEVWNQTPRPGGLDCP